MYAVTKWLAFAAAALVALPALAQSSDADSLAAQARSHLAARDPQSALTAVDGLDKLRGNQPENFDLLFLKGVTWQELALRAPAEDREAALQKSKNAYLEALKRRTGSAAVFNNLGSLHMLSGDEKTAGEWYRKAVDAGDSRRGYYALNYARSLEQRDPSQALQYARIAYEAAPDSDEARRYLGDLYRRSPADDSFARFLLQSVRDGHTKLATSLALDDLHSASSGRTPAQRATLLALVALAVAQDPAVLSQPSVTELVDRLRGLDGEPTVGPGSRQLASVLVRPPASVQDIGWWSREPVAVLERSRRAVMRDVLRVLGEQHARKQPQAAGQWLRVAIEMGERGPDLEAFLRLVELYVAQRQDSRLRELMQRFEFELFSEKGEAYQRSDWMLIYRLHLALGMTYAHMKVWTSPSPFQNAIFQLENAARAAARYNEIAQQRQRADRLALPAAAVIKLSEGYSALGQPDRATRFRIDAAGDLQQVRRVADSAEVLQSVRPDELGRLDAASKQKFSRLQVLTRE